jgi:transcriptional regulator with XRE-family HTH domain
MKAYIKKIVEYRKSKGLSINRLAELLDVSTRTIYNWENRKSQPSKTDLMAIAHLLDIRLTDISSYKETNFFYTKPGLHVNKLDESSNLLKEIINNRDCDNAIKLLPLLNVEHEIARLSNENMKLTQKVSRLRFLLDYIDAAVYTKNLKRTITYFNHSFFSLLPNTHNEEDLLGSKFSDLFSRSEYENILKLENEAFNGKYIVNQLVRIPFINNSNLSVSIRPIANNRGNIKEIIATLTIIS